MIAKYDTDTIPGFVAGIEALHYLKPYVRQCGDARRPPWRIGERCLLDYLLVYIAEGAGRFEIAGRAHEVATGDLFWIPPARPHAMEGYPPSMVCPFVHFDLIYRPDISHWDFSVPEGMTDLSDLHPLMHPDMSETPFGDLCGRLELNTNRRVGQLIRDLCVEMARAQPYAFLRSSGIMLEILGEILRGREQGIPEHNAHVPALEDAADYLREHCGDEDAITRAARKAALSTSHFRRLFAQHHGCPPRAYLRRARVQVAKQLMIGSTLNFTEIADQVGFATVHSFSRAFKAVEGVSPRQYRCFAR